jgi:3-hydroxyacyl-[acyl-carrier-protein] dehydratase
MSFDEEKESIISRLKRHPLTLSVDSATAVSYGQGLVRRILPHRAPVEFIHAINAIDLPNRMIEVVSFVPEDNPVFAGHFPDNPVYPGIYQIETMGQAALCLTWFVQQQSIEIPPETLPIQCLFTRVQNAGFIRVIKPGETLTVRAAVLECDDFMGIMAAQILIDDRICSHAILEALFF